MDKLFRINGVLMKYNSVNLPFLPHILLRRPLITSKIVKHKRLSNNNVDKPENPIKR